MRALVTGVTGQDGFYLSKLLLEKGYEVYGLVRGQDNAKADSLQRELPDLRLLSGDMLDAASLQAALNTSKPDEVYNLAGISYVPLSWDQPELVMQVNALGVLRLLEIIRTEHPHVKLVQASTSEMFGNNGQTQQNEDSPFAPQSPYGAAKLAAHYLVQVYRASYGLHASSAIMFNHESERRPERFVTRKVAIAVARAAEGYQNNLSLGNMEARRDWGFAGDYMYALWLMAQRLHGGDYVIGTGKEHSIKELVDIALEAAGSPQFQYEVGDGAHLRPSDVNHLCADAAKARFELGWAPTLSFYELIGRMVDAERDKLEAPTTTTARVPA